MYTVLGARGLYGVRATPKKIQCSRCEQYADEGLKMTYLYRFCTEHSDRT